MRAHNFINLTGERFGRWFVLELHHCSLAGAYWLCRCDCGTIKSVRVTELRNGTSQSCGCLRRELKTKHGQSGTTTHYATKEYNAWMDAKHRVSNKNNNRWHRYGKLGIRMC